MLAYHNDESIKQAVLAEMAMHRKADDLVKGQYWEDGKGCAVGCLIKSSDHSLYEQQFGIPQALARLEDCIFEGLPNEDAMLWPERFLGAINTGADLSLVQWKFLHWNLTENLTVDGAGGVFDDVRDAVTQCAAALLPVTYGKPVDKTAAESAWSAAESAESAAWSVRSAAESARSAAWSVRSAAESARSAAWSAAESAESARSAAWSAAESAESARSAAYQKMADKLIEIIKESGE